MGIGVFFIFIHIFIYLKYLLQADFDVKIYIFLFFRRKVRKYGNYEIIKQNVSGWKSCSHKEVGEIKPNLQI